MIDVEHPPAVSRWPILRVQAGLSYECELLSGDWVRIATHFLGRTFLCPEIEECNACKILPSRPYWYLPVCSIKGRQGMLLELSATASADLEQVSKFAGSNVRPGVQVLLQRKSAKKPIRVEFISTAETPKEIPLAGWVSALMAIYGLPQMNRGETLASYGERVKSKALARANYLARASEQAASVRPSGRG